MERANVERIVKSRDAVPAENQNDWMTRFRRMMPNRSKKNDE